MEVFEKDIRLVVRVNENTRKEIWGFCYKETPTFLFILTKDYDTKKIRKDNLMSVNIF